ncbi:MAG: isopentenyl-diphosphate Delta-isomerase [bacterium]|nr:isopentenyl-diphosphate Delta-isomerase [bacterium]
MKESVILVDEKDREIGTMEKLEAHEKGLLHRAFSVCIFNKKGEMLLQKRAANKYHSGGLWTNTCCSHPRPNETVLAGAKRRLREEMGIDSNLKKIAHLTYKTSFENGLTEHEYDHVLVGFYDLDPIPNPEEAEDFKWVDPNMLREEITQNPEQYTYWFRMLINEVLPQNYFPKK